MVRILFMSYAGPTQARRHEIESTELNEQAGEALQAIHQLGILHNDPIASNMAWNEEGGRVMFIDFERTTVQTERSPLEHIPSEKQPR
jgi:tRNA A-37 threonylcarbamoyl transferase component Bud32